MIVSVEDPSVRRPGSTIKGCDVDCENHNWRETGHQRKQPTQRNKKNKTKQGTRYERKSRKQRAADPERDTRKSSEGECHLSLSPNKVATISLRLLLTAHIEPGPKKRHDTEIFIRIRKNNVRKGGHRMTKIVYLSIIISNCCVLRLSYFVIMVNEKSQ